MNKLRSLYKDLKKLNQLSFGITKEEMKFGQILRHHERVNALNNLNKEEAKKYGAHTLVSTTAVYGGSYLLYKKIKKTMLDPINNKIKKLENDFDSCGIKYNKTIKNYEKDPRDNIKERLTNLENAILIYGNTHFGDPQGYKNLVHTQYTTGVLGAALLPGSIAGIKTLLIRKEIKNNNKRIENIQKELKNICDDEE